MCFGAYLVCAIYSQYTYSDTSKAPPADSNSPTQLWKTTSNLFTVALINNIMVTALYWFLLYPALEHELKEFEVLKHTVPISCLMSDFLLNNIVIEWRQLLPTMAFVSAYLSVMIGYSLPAGQYVYPILKFESQASWNLILVIVLAVFLVFALVMALTFLKYGLLVQPTNSMSIGQQDEETYMKEKGDDPVLIILLE